MLTEEETERLQPLGPVSVHFLTSPMAPSVETAETIAEYIRDHQTLPQKRRGKAVLVQKVQEVEPQKTVPSKRSRTNPTNPKSTSRTLQREKLHAIQAADQALDERQRQDRQKCGQSEQSTSAIRVTRHGYLSAPTTDGEKEKEEEEKEKEKGPSTAFAKEEVTKLPRQNIDGTRNYLALQLRLLRLLLSLLTTTSGRKERDGGEGETGRLYRNRRTNIDESEKAGAAAHEDEGQEETVLVSQQAPLAVLRFMIKTMTAPCLSNTGQERGRKDWDDPQRGDPSGFSQRYGFPARPSLRALQLALWKELLDPVPEALEPFRMRTGQVVAIQKPTLAEIGAYTEALYVQWKQNE
jgi:hypothetical protein